MPCIRSDRARVHERLTSDPQRIELLRRVHAGATRQNGKLSLGGATPEPRCAVAPRPRYPDREPLADPVAPTSMRTRHLASFDLLLIDLAETEAAKLRHGAQFDRPAKHQRRR
jgi:hypothetical protein